MGIRQLNPAARQEPSPPYLAAPGGVAGLVGGAFGAIGLAALSGMSSSDVSGGVYGAAGRRDPLQLRLQD